jgi:hypothetical protein
LSLLFQSFFLVSLFFTSESIEVIKVPNEFVPGKHQTIIFQVTNHSDESIQPEMKLQLPKGWVLITAPPKFKLNPKESKRLLYTVSLSSQATKGSEQITIIMAHQEIEIDRKVITVNVKKIHNVALDVLEKPKYLKDGENFTCRYMITNKGNVDEKIKLLSRKGSVKEKTDFILPIDSTAFVSVEQLIPKSNKTQIIVNDLSIYLQDADTTFAKNIPITVYPNQSRKSNVYHTYPIEGSLLYNTIDNIADKASFFQYDIYGKGFLDRKEKHYVELIAKGTNNSGIQRFETINRHLLVYKYKQSKIQVGDFTFGLSRLLENIRLGRGALFSQDIGKLNLVLFYNQLLYFPSVKNQMGSSFSLKPNKHYLFKFNSIYREYVVKENNSTAFSGIFNYSNETTFLKAEYATSFQNKKTGFGAFINGLYKKKEFQLNSDIMFTGKDFQGFYNNSIFNSSTANVVLNKHFSINTQVNYNFINPKDDLITAQVAPFNQSYSSALQYSKNKNTTHKVAFIYRNNKDRSEIEKFNYIENALRYSYKYKSQQLNCQLGGEIAATKNKMSSQQYVEGTSYSAFLNGDYSFKKKIKVGVFSDYLKSNRYTAISVDYLFYGASVSYNPTDKLHLNVNYRNNFPLEEWYKTNSIFNLDFKYKHNARNAISVVANYSQPSNSNEKDIFVSLKYDIRFDVPLSKNKNLGNLKGQIKCDEIENVSGVILNMNDITTISNKKGEFEFNDLTPEKYYLTIDQSTYNRNYITEQTIPLEIEITPQKTDSLTINFIKPVRINGKITYQETTQFQSNGFKNKLPQLILKLDNGIDQFFTLVNERGEYSFSEIRPGDWNLSIVTKGLENKFEFVNNSKTIKLISGVNQTIDFLVKDKSRKINIKNSNIQLKIKN